MEETNSTQGVSYTRFPRSSCSRSRASNNDLKLPAPKPEKLCRWMISMKIVGRSMRCYTCQYIKTKQDLNGYWIDAHLRKQLQQIPSLIEINQYIQIPDRLKILLQNQPGLLEPYLQVLVIRIWDLDEFNTPGSEVGDVADDIVCSKGDVLNTSAVEKVDVFFDLGLFLAFGGFVDGHFDYFVRGGHDDAF